MNWTGIGARARVRKNKFCGVDVWDLEVRVGAFMMVMAIPVGVGMRGVENERL